MECLEVDVLMGYNLPMDQKFELIVRALIVHDKKILVCQTNDRNYYFLPGGHVEFGENLRTALKRELMEEMGAVVTGAKFIGGIENLFLQDGSQRHEVSFVFHTDINNYEVESNESHVKFYWLSMDQFIEENIVPPALKDAIVQWTAEKESFFIEEKIGGSG